MHGEGGEGHLHWVERVCAETAHALDHVKQHGIVRRARAARMRHGVCITRRRARIVHCSEGANRAGARCVRSTPERLRTRTGEVRSRLDQSCAATVECRLGLRMKRATSRRVTRLEEGYPKVDSTKADWSQM